MLVAALALVVLVNLYLLRRVVRPLQALTALARRVDLAGPGERMPGAEPTSEAGELALTFNEMLERLEAERREATGRVLAGQEAERLRIARELHDQVGQELTAVLLVLSRLQARVPAELRSDVVERPGRGAGESRGCSPDRDRAATGSARRSRTCECFGGARASGSRSARRSRLSSGSHRRWGSWRRRSSWSSTGLLRKRSRTSRATRAATMRELRLHIEDGRLVLTVRDQGKGLAVGTMCRVPACAGCASARR